MPRSLNVNTQTALNSDRIIDRGMLLFDLGSGLYGFHTGLGPFVYNGVTYVGAGSLITAEDFQQSQGLQSQALVLSLTSVPNSDLTPDVLATIENEVYHQRPATVMTSYFDADTRLLLSVEIEYRGYIDQIIHKILNPGESRLEVHLESKFRDLSRTGYRKRSDEDQKRILANDNSLRHVNVVASERVLFGRTQNQTPAAAVAPRKRGGLFGLFG
jgi:hypothetical protein